MALEVNKKQWGIGAEGGAAAVTASAMCNQFLVTRAPASAFRNARACPPELPVRVRAQRGRGGVGKVFSKVFPVLFAWRRRPLRPRRLLLPPRPRRPPRRLLPPMPALSPWASLACPLTSPAPSSTALQATPLSRPPRLCVAPSFLSPSCFSMPQCVSCPVCSRRKQHNSWRLYFNAACRLLEPGLRSVNCVSCDLMWVVLVCPLSLFVHYVFPGWQFLGMAGPRAAGHRDKFGGKHVCPSLLPLYLTLSTAKWLTLSTAKWRFCCAGVEREIMWLLMRQSDIATDGKHLGWGLRVCCARLLGREETEGDAGQGMYHDTPETQGRESESRERE
jgi:hypothetical protein